MRVRNASACNGAGKATLLFAHAFRHYNARRASIVALVRPDLEWLELFGTTGSGGTSGHGRVFRITR
jgi:hypothetical protein